MEVLHKKRTIGWLIDKVSEELPPEEINILMRKFLEEIFLFRVTAVYDWALEFAKSSGFSDPISFARAARWLAIIYRDYGVEILRSVLDIVEKVNELNPKKTKA